jgi:hypothetical protein
MYKVVEPQKNSGDRGVDLCLTLAKKCTDQEPHRRPTSAAISASLLLRRDVTTNTVDDSSEERVVAMAVGKGNVGLESLPSAQHQHQRQEKPEEINAPVVQSQEAEGEGSWTQAEAKAAATRSEEEFSALSAKKNPQVQTDKEAAGAAMHVMGMEAGSGFGGGGGGEEGGEEGDDGDDQGLLEAALKVSLDAPQPALDDDVILHLFLAYIHVFQVSLAYMNAYMLTHLSVSLFIAILFYNLIKKYN